MQTKPLLYGLIGFFLGGLVVSVAATTFDKPNHSSSNSSSMSSTSMDDMTADLKDKTDDEYDKAFISSMIAHHEGAVEMAKLSAKNAKHSEIKQLSTDIISAQEEEIRQMKEWQKEWGYSSTESNSHMMH